MSKISDLDIVHTQGNVIIDICYLNTPYYRCYIDIIYKENCDDMIEFVYNSDTFYCNIVETILMKNLIKIHENIYLKTHNSNFKL